MAAKLKVFSGLSFVGSKQVKTIVATTSQAKAAELVGFSINDFRNFWSVTGNKEQIAIAESRPGTVFRASGIDSDDYQPVISESEQDTIDAIVKSPLGKNVADILKTNS